MATYGKKRSLFPGFSVFQDDQLRPVTGSRISGKSTVLLACGSVTESCSATTRLGRAKTVVQKSKPRFRSDDDSMDELAGDPLLLNSVQQPVRSSFQSDVPMPEPLRPRSSRAIEKALDKPLPPIPSNEPENQSQPKKTKPALGIKTTNMRIPAKVEKPPLRPKISNPMLQNSEENDNNSALRLIDGISEDKSGKAPKTSTTDAELLNKKITTLMQEASAREAQHAPKTKKARAAADFMSKPSPLQRGKIALSKATRAIAGRLNSGRRPMTPNIRRPGPIESSPNSFKALEYHPEPRARSPTIERRIAERENLSNIKIQSITGDGSIPRKPLPVYESMKSQRSSADSLVNPFSDGNQTEGTISPNIHAELDFDFNRRKGKSKPLSRAPFSFDDVAPDVTSKASTETPRPLGFSNNISGLAQHSDVMAFSSSPIGYSTPRTRLDPDPRFHAQKKVSSTLKRSPSILEFSFEESDEEEISTEPKTSHPPDPTMSVKRKSANNDLRSRLSPNTAKRPRRTSDVSRDDLDLLDEFRQLDTHDLNALPDNKSAGLERPTTADSKVKGLNIFEAARGKVPFTSAAALAKRPRVRMVTAGRTSIPRPNSILFSRESRAHFRLRDTTDGDTMEIDELQMYDGCFSVGGAAKK